MTHLPTSPPLLLRRIGTDPHMEFWFKVVQISTSCFFYARAPIRPLWGPGSDLNTSLTVPMTVGNLKEEREKERRERER